MATRLGWLGIAAASIAVGTLYVVVHESRRKRKKAEKLARDAPISKELLLAILNKSADASKVVIERIRVEVRKIQQQRNLSDEQAMQLFQQNFEHSLDQLIGAIRNQFQVTEKAMDASFKEHQADPEVQQAIQNMRMLSSPQASSGGGGGAAVASNASGASSGTASSAEGSSTRAPAGSVSLPASLTKERLREIMTFNAVMLEKELRPIKEEVEKVRRQGKQAQLDPSVLMQVQMRISEAVRQRFGVSDEQVMAAVDHFGAKNDPSFKDILQRIATTLSSSLG